MTFKTPLILSTIAILTLTACVDPNQFPDDPKARTRGGAVTGALIGGVLGGASGGDNKAAKAVTGAVIGGLIGGAIGSEMDNQAAELRAQLSGNSTVTNANGVLTVTMPQDVLFALDSASLRPDLRADLRSVAGSLISYPNSTVEVIGHTDNSGAAAYNMDLSQRRAMAVSSVLQSSGVPASRIAAFGRGEDQPIASNLTSAGQAQNRRVEIIIRPNR